MTDWGPALAEVGLASEDWGPTYRGTYAELVQGWRSSFPIPSEAALLAAINVVNQQPDTSELTAEELYDILATKGILLPQDRPRTKKAK